MFFRRPDLRLLVAFGVIQQKKDRKGDDGIDRGASELVTPINVEVSEPKESPINEEEQEAVDKKETKVDKDAGREVLDVDLDADAGCNVADDRLRHSVDAYGLRSKSVLKQSNGCSGESAGDRIAARDRKENGDNQREIENGEPRKGSGKQRLQQDRA